MKTTLSPKQIELVERFALGYYKKLNYAHNVNHAIRTVKLAEYLAREEGANVQVCRLGALLHQFHDRHAVEVFLARIGIDKDTIAQLLHCVECSTRTNIHKAQTLEAKIVFDADKLQVLGPFGFCRQFGDLMTTKGASFDKAIQETWRIENDVYNDYLQTATARRIIRAPHKQVMQFLKTFREWDRVKFYKPIPK
jgi:uncharacterized protein